MRSDVVSDSGLQAPAPPHPPPAPPPPPSNSSYIAKPTSVQASSMTFELEMFLHFSINTFSTELDPVDFVRF